MKTSRFSTIVASLSLVSIASLAAASTATYQGSDGIAYQSVENEHGAKLSGDNNDVLYLGKSCDASHSSLGSGSWGWANGGFCATLEGGRICFMRQEPPVENDENCYL